MANQLLNQLVFSASGKLIEAAPGAFARRPLPWPSLPVGDEADCPNLYQYAGGWSRELCAACKPMAGIFARRGMPAGGKFRVQNRFARMPWVPSHSAHRPGPSTW
jgi:hypothetical protein